MPIYYPRMFIAISAPVMGSATEKKILSGNADMVSLSHVRVNRATLCSNDFNHADTLEVSCAYSDSGLDPRFLKGAVCKFYMGDVNEPGALLRDSDLRFMGIFKRGKRSLSEGGMQVHLTFYDYTTLFIGSTNFPSSGIPEYALTLRGAWEKICDHTGIQKKDGSILSTVARIRDKFRTSPSVGNPTLGEAVIPRLRSFGKMQVKPGCDAWGVWQACVQSLGLISYIYLDTCYVVTATDYYTANDAPRLIWGHNIESIDEDRNSDFSNKGVGVTSFDPLTYTTLEAVYPPDGDQRLVTKPAMAAPGHKEASTAKSEESDRAYFHYPAVSSQARLDEIAKRIYEERSRQELEGTVKTSEMRVDTESGLNFDLLALKAGDCVKVEIDQKTKAILANASSSDDRIVQLMERGYSAQVARLLEKNMIEILSLSNKMFVKAVRTSFSVDEHSGTFDIEINYCNRLDLDGNAANGTLGGRRVNDPGF